VPRIDGDRFAIICDRVVNLILSPVGEASTRVGIGVFWADFDNLGEIRDRTVVVALSFEDATAVEVGVGVPRIIAIVSV